MTLKLRRDYAAGIRAGRPWVFRDAVEPPQGCRAGDVVDLVDGQGAFVARGLVEPESQLVFRAYTLDPDEAVDARLVERRVADARRLRNTFVPPDVTGFRAMHGEADGVPGLQCDLYDGVASLRTDGRIGIVWEERFVRAVKKVWNPRAVVVRNPHRDDCKAVVIEGRVEHEVIIAEGPRRFRVNVLEGQKTGFFLDQRENRDRVGRLSQGRRVLNCFAYTGGFSIAAAQGGASRVVTVDIARPAVDAARENFRLNGLDPDVHGFEAADAFDVLAALKPGDFDLIVVDPPSFAPNQKSLDRALRAYQKLNEHALRALPPGGILASASCSSHVTEAAFLDMLGASARAVGRAVTVTGIYGAGADHPVRLGFPEGRYLDFVLLIAH